MAMQTLQLGITSVQNGNRAEGARLIRIALKRGELSGELAAIAYLWLAETSDDPEHKRAAYSEAVNADPNNSDARQRLAALLASGLPGQTTHTQDRAANHPQASPAGRDATPGSHIAGVVGGPNGPGTAFFVSQDGLLVTTRYVTGGLERITVEFSGGRQVEGQMVRAFPEMDIALIRVNEGVNDLPPITPYPRIPDETPLTAFAYLGRQVRGKQRPTKRVMAAHWIATDITKLADAGGNPLYDGRNYLVGMLTKNYSRASGYVYGVHINAIRGAVDTYRQESGSGEARTYCPQCGVGSQAIGSGYFYCEVCGGTATQAHQFNRTPRANPYEEVSRIRCAVCGSHSGFYQNRCLRCGQSPQAPAQYT